MTDEFMNKLLETLSYLESEASHDGSVDFDYDQDANEAWAFGVFHAVEYIQDALDLSKTEE